MVAQLLINNSTFKRAVLQDFCGINHAIKSLFNFLWKSNQKYTKYQSNICLYDIPLAPPSLKKTKNS